MNGFAFKIERLRRDLSQWDVARLSDLPPYKISAFEQGRTRLAAEEIQRLNDALKTVEPQR